MRLGLAILTFVPVGASSGVKSRLPTALASLKNSGYDKPVFVIDDGSTDASYLEYLRTVAQSVPVIQRPENGGISRAKNTCLRVLSEARVEVGFVAEDDIAFFPGWWESYLRAHQETRVQHFSWAWDRDPGGMHKDVREICGYPVVATNLVNGVLLSFTPTVLQTVGGFKILPAIWGHEHTHWTNRIILAGLAPFYADVIDSNRYVRLNRYANHSTIGPGDRSAFALQNAQAADDLSTLFQPLLE